MAAKVTSSSLVDPEHLITDLQLLEVQWRIGEKSTLDLSLFARTLQVFQKVLVCFKDRGSIVGVVTHIRTVYSLFELYQDKLPPDTPFAALASSYQKITSYQ